MALLARLRPGHRLPGISHLALLLVGMLSTAVASAQVADVVRPDAQGEFKAIRIDGPRGSSPQRFWLVVDRDPRGLLCRDERGLARIALRYGAVVELEQPEQQLAPLLLQGKPYLLVAAKPVDILHDARFMDRGRASSCRVRANSAYLAPIQMESMQQVLFRPGAPCGTRC